MTAVPFDSHVHGTDPFLRTEPFDRHQPDPPDRRPDLVCLSDVPAADVRWLWPGRIPLGRVTLLVSDPGVGKSLLALDIAARVSRAAAWPDQKPDHAPAPGSVLLLTAQDELADTVRPRLEAAGADLAKIHAVQSSRHTPCAEACATSDSPRPFHLHRDLDQLRELLDRLPDCRLIVIDPISAFLGGRLERSNTEVQHLVNALAQLARDRDLAILAVSHFRKKQGAAIHRAIGSVGFVAAARTAWALAPDPDDPDRRLFLPLKNNLGPNPDPLAFTIEPTASAPANSPPRPLAPAIRWSDQPVELTAEAALAGRPRGRPDHELRHAVHWLQNALADGPRPVRHIQQEAEANGHTQRTLFRAFHLLGGQARRRGSFLVGQWYWLLPPTPQPAPDPTSPTPTAAGAPDPPAAPVPAPANSPSPDDEHFWQSWENLDDFAPLEPPTPTQPTPTPPPNTHPPASTTHHPAPTTPPPGLPRSEILCWFFRSLAEQIGETDQEERPDRHTPRRAADTAAQPL